MHLKLEAKRLLSAFLSFTLLMAIFPVDIFAFSGVDSADSLAQAIASGVSEIRIDSDFLIDRTFFITKDITIYSETPHVLKRDPDFGGDMFVVGEDENGINSVLNGNEVHFALGKPGISGSNLLTIDGNRDNMAAEVNGTILFICNGAEANIHAGVCIENCLKTSNSRALEERYYMSDPEYIGGSVGIVAGGSLNLYGGLIKHNAVNMNDDGSVGSFRGGAFFNYATLRFFGATVEDSQAARGGAIYNYRKLHLYRGTMSDNVASSYGGAIYQANSQFAETLICEAHGDFGSGVTPEFLICNNTAQKSAGAIFSQSKTAVIINSGARFVGNKTQSNGGAINSYGTLTISDAVFENNYAESKGGAIYICNNDSTLTTRFSDIGTTYFNGNTANRGGAIAIMAAETDYENGGIANIHGCTFDGNGAIDPTADASGMDVHGGAIYVGRKSTLTLEDSILVNNTAVNNGGAIYSSKSTLTVRGSKFTGNTSEARENPEGKQYGGGAVYSTGSNINIIDSEFTENSSAYNGGAIAVYSQSSLNIEDALFVENMTAAYGGAIYVNNSSLSDKQSQIKRNFSEKNGGAIACYTGSDSHLRGTVISNNSADNNGGGVYFYTGGTAAELRDVTLQSNQAKNYGGAIYASEKSSVSASNLVVRENNAKQGGALYETTTGTEFTLYSVTLDGNIATDKGPIIYGNTTKATLFINKTQYTDLQQSSLDANYWAGAIMNKLTVKEITESGVEPTPSITTPPAIVLSEPVDVIFSLADSSPNNGHISDAYDALPVLDHNSNFMSRGTREFPGINNNTVTVDTFVYNANDKAHNPNVGEGLLIYQAMDYKRNHPHEDVTINITSFHFSVQAAVCINRNSRYFGYMRQLSGVQYDEFGFVRVAYLLVCAAKMGIHVNVVPHLEAYPISEGEPMYRQYFSDYMNQSCDPNYTNNLIGDYLKLHAIEWTSYGDDAASDMMHSKLCTVTAYRDQNGVDHGASIWLSCTNLDGILDTGENSNAAGQTAVIVSDHPDLVRIAHNYVQLVSRYTGQEDVYVFREVANNLAKKQIDLILAGKESEIPLNEQIVYLGGTEDPVFELYFAPFGGDAISWTETYNPYCKYLAEMRNSKDGLLSILSINKFNLNFTLNHLILDTLFNVYRNNPTRLNRLYADIPNVEWNALSDLTVEQDIGFSAIELYAFSWLHNKDILLSYVKEGQRNYVSLITSLNLHQGAGSYQSNQVLVVKETDCELGGVFYTLADNLSIGVVGSSVPEDPVLTTPIEIDQGQTTVMVPLDNPDPNAQYIVYTSELNAEKATGVSAEVSDGHLIISFSKSPESDITYYIGSMKHNEKGNVDIFSAGRAKIDITVISAENAGGISGGGGGGGFAQPATITIRFESNGGSKVKSINHEVGKLLVCNDYLPTRDGYEFGGWYFDSALTQVAGTIDPKEDIVLYAKWNASVNPLSKFVDVPEDAYYSKAVAWALENGITSGTTETTFGPKIPATRAQVMTFIWAASGCPEPESSKNPFKDVKESSYYRDAVLWAYEQGITAGISADMFGPDIIVSRGQIVTFLYGVAGRPGVGSEPFVDVEETDYFVDPVAWAYQKGITSGTSLNTFSPYADCLREQIITFLYLYFTE